MSVCFFWQVQHALCVWYVKFAFMFIYVCSCMCGVRCGVEQKPCKRSLISATVKVCYGKSTGIYEE